MSLSPWKVVEGLLGVEGAIADFIAGGPSEGFPGHVRDEYRKRCNQFANLPGWARALGGVPGGSMRRICTPYWDDNGWDGPVIDSPFSGGQCPVPYTCTIQSPTAPGSPLGGSFVASGPIASAAILSEASTNPSLARRLYLRVVDSTGATLRNSGFNTNGLPSAVSPWLTKTSGLPDDCGDPPGTLEPGGNPPPNPAPTPGPEPTPDPASPSGPPLLPVAPYFDPVWGDIPVEGPDDTAGGTPVPGNPETAPGSPDNIGDGIAGAGDAEDGEDVSFGDPPEGKVFIGALVKFQFPESLGNIAGSGPKNLVVPRAAGNVSLVFDGGRGTAEQVRSEWVYVLRPHGALKVTGVFINAVPDTTFIVYPLSVETCPENTCGG